MLTVGAHTGIVSSAAKDSSADSKTQHGGTGMLVLTRKPQAMNAKQSTVVIEADSKRIEVTVAQVKNGQVRLAFAAPSEVKITRKELESKGTEAA